jgi:glutamine synthetase
MSWSGLPDTVRTVECAVADFTSVARGKVVARADFEAMRGCKLPSVVLGVTLTGGEPAAVFGPLPPEAYGDLHLEPDLATAVPVAGHQRAPMFRLIISTTETNQLASF